jgi:hypothetical protein
MSPQLQAAIAAELGEQAAADLAKLAAELPAVIERTRRVLFKPAESLVLEVIPRGCSIELFYRRKA